MQKKDILEFELNEINSPWNWKENEDNELEEEYKILFNAGKISEKLGGNITVSEGREFSILTALEGLREQIWSSFRFVRIV